VSSISDAFCHLVAHATSFIKLHGVPKKLDTVMYR